MVIHQKHEEPACSECRRAHKACNRGNPCARCIKNGHPEKCMIPVKTKHVETSWYTVDIQQNEDGNLIQRKERLVATPSQLESTLDQEVSTPSSTTSSTIEILSHTLEVLPPIRELFSIADESPLSRTPDFPQSPSIFDSKYNQYEANNQK